MESLDQFIASQDLQFTCEPAKNNPNMQGDMPQGTNHWLCTILNTEEDYRMVVPFSQGPAISKPPSLADVLDCLASDAAGYENAQSFEDWAGEYGYDTDSRKAYRIYETVKEQALELQAVLGGEAYEQLLWNTERQ
jgi:hypothetical protein